MECFDQNLSFYFSCLMVLRLQIFKSLKIKFFCSFSQKVWKEEVWKIVVCVYELKGQNIFWHSLELTEIVFWPQIGSNYFASMLQVFLHFIIFILFQEKQCFQFLFVIWYIEVIMLLCFRTDKNSSCNKVNSCLVSHKISWLHVDKVATEKIFFQ